MWKTLLALPAVLMLTATDAGAACVCTCVNGQVQALCSSALAMRPLCAPRLCPMLTPSLRPMALPRLPPLGTSACSLQQVLDPYPQRYAWRQVCF